MDLKPDQSRSLFILGWQSECAKQGAFLLVHSFPAPEGFKGLGEATFDECIHLGRYELRRHLAALRGNVVPTPIEHLEVQAVFTSDAVLQQVREGRARLAADIAKALESPVMTDADIEDERKAFRAGHRMLGMLAELGAGWRVTIRNHRLGPGETTPPYFEVEIIAKKPLALIGRGQHRYRGEHLPTLIARAWAGEPGDE